jgi:hypothetical protein
MLPAISYRRIEMRRINIPASNTESEMMVSI